MEILLDHHKEVRKHESIELVPSVLLGLISGGRSRHDSILKTSSKKHHLHLLDPGKPVGMIEFEICGDCGGDNRGGSGHGVMRGEEREREKRESSDEVARFDELAVIMAGNQGP